MTHANYALIVGTPSTLNVYTKVVVEGGRVLNWHMTKQTDNLTKRKREKRTDLPHTEPRPGTTDVLAQQGRKISQHPSRTHHTHITTGLPTLFVSPYCQSRLTLCIYSAFSSVILVILLLCTCKACRCFSIFPLPAPQESSNNFLDKKTPFEQGRERRREGSSSLFILFCLSLL